MRKILMLGGSAQQVVAITTAKQLGYETVLCDYLEDNPGQFVADKYYLASTTDKDLMLRIATEEKVDGVVAYASDPAAPTAAYVAEKLGLHTNPYESVEIMCNKDRFRNFLLENGFNSPQASGFSTIEEAVADKECFHLPVIVKPVDSSGSKGATVLYSWEHIIEALEEAFSFSRSHRIIIEEFIEKKHPYLIGGDLFVWDGKIILWGLLNCHRDNTVNPLVPVGKSYPPKMDDMDLKNVKMTLQSMVDKLCIQSGAINVELVVDTSGRVWPIDVGPRNGGNMIPDLLGLIFRTDVVKMTIQAVMGEVPQMNMDVPIPFYATHNLHSSKNGKFAGIHISDRAQPYVIRKCIYKKPGDYVEYFDNAAKALGIVFFKFDSHEVMEEILGDINFHIQILLQE